MTERDIEVHQHPQLIASMRQMEEARGCLAVTAQGTAREEGDPGSSLVGTTGPMGQSGKSFWTWMENSSGDFAPPLPSLL